jgi:hypothetical protein
VGRDAHLWAEAHFEGLGWVTFDATPPMEQEAQPEVRTYKTVTNITFNDPVALKGGTFQVHGTVTLENGTGVDGLTVEVFLTLKKNDTDASSGTGVVRDGFFNITSDAATEMAVGDYNLIAHTMPGGIYEESWSDPPIRIMADTNVTIGAPASAYVGDRISIGQIQRGAHPQRDSHRHGGERYPDPPNRRGGGHQPQPHLRRGGKRDREPRVGRLGLLPGLREQLRDRG